MTARLRLAAPLLCALLLAPASGLGRSTPAGPTPEAFFGFRMGAADHLVDWDGMVRYFAELDRLSDRMTVETVGQTTGGRPYLARRHLEPRHNRINGAGARADIDGWPIRARRRRPKR